jgi:hypothetical protein
VQFYPDAEAILAQVSRRGVPMILKRLRNGITKPCTPDTMSKVVRKVRAAAPGLPDWFTLDTCRHGGMTELEEAELTDGQGRALSAHRSKAYEGYAKRTMERALAATRKRHAHLMAGNGEKPVLRTEPEQKFSECRRKSFRMRGEKNEKGTC